MPLTTVLLAEDPPAAPNPGAQGGLFGSPLMLIALIGLFFVVVILPQSRRTKREQAAMLAAMKVGSKVVTSGGIVGTITKAVDGEDEITIRSEDARLRVLRSTVVRVVEDKPAEVKA